jgi:hypothetical protein
VTGRRVETDRPPIEMTGDRPSPHGLDDRSADLKTHEILEGFT